MTLIALLIVLLLVLILIVLWQLAGDMRSIVRDILPDIRAIMLKRPPPQGGVAWPHRHDGTCLPHGGDGIPIGSFVIWIWRHGEWHLQPVPFGIRPGLPPAYPGAFNGDVAKTWAISSVK
jgi:hypothetical protein